MKLLILLTAVFLGCSAQPPVEYVASSLGSAGTALDTMKYLQQFLGGDVYNQFMSGLSGAAKDFFSQANNNNGYNNQGGFNNNGYGNNQGGFSASSYGNNQGGFNNGYGNQGGFNNGYGNNQGGFSGGYGGNQGGFNSGKGGNQGGFNNGYSSSSGFSGFDYMSFADSSYGLMLNKAAYAFQTTGEFTVTSNVTFCPVRGRNTDGYSNYGSGAASGAYRPPTGGFNGTCPVPLQPLFEKDDFFTTTGSLCVDDGKCSLDARVLFNGFRFEVFTDAKDKSSCLVERISDERAIVCLKLTVRRPKTTSGRYVDYDDLANSDAIISAGHSAAGELSSLLNFCYDVQKINAGAAFIQRRPFIQLPVPGVAPGSCPPYSVWTECGSACPRSCTDRNPLCAAVCVPRCQCTNGYVQHQGNCILESQCPSGSSVDAYAASNDYSSSGPYGSSSGGDQYGGSSGALVASLTRRLVVVDSGVAYKISSYSYGGFNTAAFQNAAYGSSSGFSSNNNYGSSAVGNYGGSAGLGAGKDNGPAGLGKDGGPAGGLGVGKDKDNGPAAGFGPGKDQGPIGGNQGGNNGYGGNQGGFNSGYGGNQGGFSNGGNQAGNSYNSYGQGGNQGASYARFTCPAFYD